MSNILVTLGLYILNNSLHKSNVIRSSIFSTQFPKLLEDDLDYKGGYNEVEFNHPDDSVERLYKINEMFNKKKLLLLLESNSVSQNEKLELIKRDINPPSYVPSIISGGLMDDWEFNLHKE